MQRTVSVSREKTIQKHCQLFIGSHQPINLHCICDVCIVFARVCSCVHSYSPFCVSGTSNSSQCRFSLLQRAEATGEGHGHVILMVVWWQYIDDNQHFYLYFSLCLLVLCLQIEVHALCPFIQSSSYSLLHTGQIICSLLMAHLKLQLLIFQDCVTQHQETCFVPWYELAKQGFYFSGCLPLQRTGFNNSIISVLFAEGQWFHGWKITETLSFANTSLYGL